MELYLALAFPILIITAWFYTSQMTRRSLPTFRDKRICLLIAHPDDEAMFFSPTLSTLTAPELGNHVKILCLSSGDADGLGETRKAELALSAKLLGLRAATDVLVLEDDAFPDSMSIAWPEEKIAQVLSSAFVPAAGKGKSGQPPKTTVDVVITFDGQGVSNHPNHICLYHGAKSWIAGLMKGKEGWKSPVELYTLSSVNVLRKYISFLDGATTLFIGAARSIIHGKRKKSKEDTASLVFISGLVEYRNGQNAMTKGHSSQMRWFRWGWIAVGRYMIVNDLRRENI
ncbi:uncharacterized protein KY384_004894 [Bacidia gigantensis]|uniref:uncharacterized protein n=1 Tax=Bacidia gigantensis TaxID=2732470 RepID=UPI001D03E49F|nr:uncharacterized protein KY384_004894 [Bacidia gigantensis]KAG8530392.1 hypothetical protein KY384_004894 [Bacidia gigantensis]